MKSLRLLCATVLLAAATPSFAAAVGGRGLASSRISCSALHDNDTAARFTQSGTRLRACQMALRACNKWATANGKDLNLCKVETFGSVED